MRIPAASTFLLLCLVISVTVGVVGMCGVVTAQSAPDQSYNQTISIQLQSDGDATFVLTQTMQLNSSEERAAFETLADEFVRGEYDIGGTSIIALVDDVAEHTDRTMAVVDEQRNSTITNDTGILRHTFTWTNFATTTHDHVRIGEAFHLDGTHWLGNLTATQRLVIVPPDGYRIESSTQSVTDGRLVWTGPTTFAVGDIQATFIGSGTSGIDQQTIILAGGGIVLFGLLAALAWGYRGRLRTTDAPSDTTDSRPSTDDQPATTAPTDTADTPDSASSDEREQPPAAADSSSMAASEAADVDPDLLSDEEYVEWLLERNGGRMKQATIVEETGWSSAKASQVLSGMDDADRIDKLRIGRENLIALPSEQITDPADE